MFKRRVATAWKALASTLAATLVAGVAIAGVAAPAQAVEAEVSGASASWGFRDSFINYINGPIASGNASTFDGATGGTRGPFGFSQGTGTIEESDNSKLSVALTGGVHFRGHLTGTGDDAFYNLDYLISNLKIDVTGNTGTLRATVESRAAYASFPLVPKEEIVFADLTVASVTPNPAGNEVTFVLNGTFSDQANATLGGMYPGGDIAPITLTVPYTIPAVSTVTALVANPTDGAEVGDPVVLAATVSPVAAGEVTFRDGEIDLGVVAVNNGVASFTADALTAGAHSLTAVFTPSDAAAFNGSTSEVLSYTVSEPVAVSEPEITVSPSEPLDPTVENVLTIDGSGFTGASAVNGAYVLFGLESVWKGEGPLPSAGWVSLGWVQPGSITDGEFSTTVTIPANTLDPSQSYHVATSAAHGLSQTDRSLDAFATVAVQSSPVEEDVEIVVVGPDDEPLSEAVQGEALRITASGFAPGETVRAEVHSDPVEVGTEIADDEGTVTFSWNVPVDFPAGPHTVRLFGETSGLEGSVPLTITTEDDDPVEWDAQVEVFLADGTTPYAGQELVEGDEIVVRGSGFDPAANVGGRGAPIPNTLPQGVYVVFGSFLENWQPSNTPAAPAANRSVLSQQWVLLESTLDQVPSNYRPAIERQWVELTTEGDFEARLSISDLGNALEDGRFGVYTYPAGGTVNADQERYVPLTITTEDDDPVEWDAQVEVFLADGTTPYAGQELVEGDEIVVRGSGFDPAANVSSGRSVIPEGLPSGFYLAFGSFLEDWRPSESAPSSARKTLDTRWALTADTLDQVDARYQGTIQSQWVELSEDGTFEARLSISDLGNALEDGRFGVYTYPAGGTVNADQERYVPLTITTEDDDDTDPVVVPPADVCLAVGTGSFSWGLKDSFRNYIVGGIARGSIATEGTVSQAANNGVFTWTNSSGSVDLDANTGVIAFSGGVHFTGHDGELDLKLTQPTLHISSATEGVLYADVDGIDLQGNAVGGENIPFANVTFTLDSSANQLSIISSTVALTEAGAEAFVEFYAPGEALDQFSLSVPLGTEVECDEPAAPAPIAPSVGLFVDGNPVSQVAQGQQVTIVGSNYPTGQSVGAVVRSTPVDLGTSTADIRGQVSYEWTVPADFTPGSHTVTLTADGLQPATRSFTVIEGSATGGTGTGGQSSQGEVCVASAVSGGALSWGLKESFRSYIQGPVARGSWSTSGVSGTFTWSGGSGAYNSEADRGSVRFAGSVNFTGHSGVLDMRIANPRIQINSATSATLYLDVQSKGYNTADVNASGVRFATISLPQGAVSGGQITWSNASVTLTAAGAEAFAGFYSAGERLDPLTLTLPLGADVECDDSTRGDLAATGTDSAALGLIAGLLLVGTGLVAVRRQGTKA